MASFSLDQVHPEADIKPVPKLRGYTRRRPFNDDRAKAWRCMRILRMFTLPQLKMTSEIRMDNLFFYVRRLVQAGYLRIAKKRETGRPGSYTVFQLARNTGPLQPIPQRSGMVYDPNVREVFGQSDSELTRNGIDWPPAPASEQSHPATANMGPQARQTIKRNRNIESEARRAARRIGLVANKARGRRSDNNRGGFALIDPVEGRKILGKKFDLAAEDVITHCQSLRRCPTQRGDQ